MTDLWLHLATIYPNEGQRIEVQLECGGRALMTWPCEWTGKLWRPV